MIASVLQESFKRSLSTVLPAVAGKSTLPVLSNVLIRAAGDGLTLTATNLEIGVTDRIGAQVAEDGAVTLPAKLLSDVVGSLPNDKITLTLDSRTQSVKLECGRFTTNIKGIEADEFPTVPGFGTADPALTLPADVMGAALGQVVFSAASDDSRPVLAGVLTRVKDGTLTLAAADGFRLAVRTVPASEATPFEAIIPARSLDMIAKLASNAETVELLIAPNGNQALFRVGSTELVTRLIDGRFPDVERIIPQQHTTRIIVDVAALMKAVKLAALFAVQAQNVIRLAFAADGGITITANAAEVGDNQGSVEASVAGDGGTISLNVKYLTDLLGTLKGSVAIETQTPQSPGVFRPVGQDGYVHVIMPMSPR
jgi:DNA polymerase III subunit beta